MTHHPHLGQRLRAWRETNGLSCADVGVAVHLEPGLVQALENGDIPGSTHTQAAIEELITHTPLEDAAVAAIAAAVRLIRAGDDIEIVIRRCRSEEEA